MTSNLVVAQLADQASWMIGRTPIWTRLAPSPRPLSPSLTLKLWRRSFSEPDDFMMNILSQLLVYDLSLGVSHLTNPLSLMSTLPSLLTGLRSR